jgi:TP901 family phage tail tape measure protein
MTTEIDRYKITLDYDTSTAEGSLSQFRSKVLSQLKDLTNTSAKIDLFRDLQQDIKGAGVRLTELAAKADELRRILRNTDKGADGYKDLALAVKAADREYVAAVKSAGGFQNRLKELSTELRSAGVNTEKLADEQLRLAASLEKAQRAAQVQGGRQTLGIQGADELRAQLANLQNQYNTLRTSGTASLQDLAVAKAALVRQTLALNESQQLVNTNMQQLGVAVIGIVSSTYAYSQALRAVISAASQYEQSLASIASITNLNKAQLDALGDSVLQLSGRIGLDATAAFKALYNIIGSGIPAENSISVLEASAKAAVAGLTSVENAARIGVQVLNAYQLQTSELPRVFDILFQTVRDGVISFEELADKFGLVLPAARSAGVSLEELSGATVVLTRSGLNAPRAMVALEGAIKQLAAPTEEAAVQASKLGIQYKGLVGTIEQFAKLDIGPELLRKLIPDVEGQRAVQLLRQNLDLLKTSVNEAGGAANATQAAFNKLKDTPEQEFKKFSAEVNRAAVALGKALLEGVVPIVQGITDLVRRFNDLGPAAKSSAATVATLAGALAVGAVAASTLTPLIAPIAAGLSVMGAAGVASSAALNGLRLAITGLLPVAAAGATGFALGEKLRETSAWAKNLGDFLGGTLAATVIEVGLLFDQLKAKLAGNRDEYELTTAAIARNRDQYAELRASLVGVGFEIKELEVKQAALRTAVLNAQAAVGEAGAKYGEALSPVFNTVNTAIGVLNTNIAGAESALNGFLKRIDELSKSSSALLDSQLKGLEQTLGASLEGIESQLARGQVSQLAATESITTATAANYSKRFEAIKAYSVNAQALFDAEAIAQRAIAKKTGEDITRVDFQIRDSKIALLGAIRTKYEETFKALANEEQKLLTVAKNADEARRFSKLDVEEKIRVIQRGLLTPYQQYYDQVREIDRALDQSRTAYLKGDLSKAETYARKAIELSTQIGQAVTDKEGNVVISARRAAQEATDKLRTSGSQLDLVLQKQNASAIAGAKAFGDQATSARAAGDEIGKAVDALSKEQGKAIPLRVSADLESVKAEADKLQVALDARIPLLKVKAEFETAKSAYEVFKKSIEENAPFLKVQADFEDLKKKTTAALQSLPVANINVDSSKITAALTGLETGLIKFNASKITLQSNVEEIQQKVNQLKLNTQSTHTITERYIPDPSRPREAPTQPIEPKKFAIGGLVNNGVARFAAGGIVGNTPQQTATKALAQPGGIQRFARGGFVGLVPGVGNTDSVRVALQDGSFVLRKVASNFLRNVSGSDGGRGSDDLIAQVNKAPSLGRAPLLGRLFSRGISELEQNVTKFREGKPLGLIEPGAERVSREFAQTQTARALNAYNEAVAANSAARADKETASSIELYRRISGPLNNDIFGGELKDRAVADSLQDSLANERDPKKRQELEQQLRELDRPTRRAEGGGVGGSGMVDALVMPGEIAFSPEQVKAIGLKRLNALNAASNPRSFDRALLARYAEGGHVESLGSAMSSAIMPTIRKFNAGGAVTNTTNNAGASNVSINQTFNVAGSDVNVRAIAQQLRGELQNIDRRSR